MAPQEFAIEVGPRRLDNRSLTPMLGPVIQMTWVSESDTIPSQEDDMDSLEQWIFDIGRHVGALECENEVLNETIEELKAKDPNALEAALESTEACHLDALDQIEELENELGNMTRSCDWFRRQYEELLRKPVPHDPLVKAAEDACGRTKPEIEMGILRERRTGRRRGS